MVDLLAIGQGLSSLKVASDIAKGLISLCDEAKLAPQVIELNRRIVESLQALTEASQEQATLLKAIDHLEAEIA